MGTGAVVLAGLVLTLVAPRAAHAIAATAVLVENTRSSPVPNQDVDIAARHVYTMACETFSGTAQCVTGSAVPANNEFVIQNVSIGYLNNGVNFSSLPAAAGLTITEGGAVNSIGFPVLQQMNQGAGNYELEVNQQVTLYADPGTTPGCVMVTAAGVYAQGATVFSCALTGYLVSLP